LQHGADARAGWILIAALFEHGSARTARQEDVRDRTMTFFSDKELRLPSARRSEPGHEAAPSHHEGDELAGPIEREPRAIAIARGDLGNPGKISRVARSYERGPERRV
jgi:hypothetical protein